MWIGHQKEIRKLTFRALALRRSDSLETLETLETASESLYGGQFTLSTQLIKPNYHTKRTLSHIVIGFFGVWNLTAGLKKEVRGIE